jgi:hypothetical protein
MKRPQIFSDCYQLTIHIFYRTKSFAKPLRPTIGRRLEEASLDLTKYIGSALYESKAKKDLRREFLLKSSLALDELKILVQLAAELRVLPVTGLAELQELISNIGNQLGGLRRATETDRPSI